MAETFTSDNTTETEVLTEEEQDSLAVGEKMMAEQEGLLAGKYKNAEDLEAAYISLQKKLGEKSDAESLPQTEGNKEATQEEVKEEVKPSESPAVSLINEASEEYYSNDGTLSEKTIEKFSQMSSQDLVSAYLELQKNAPQTKQKAPDLTESQANQIKNAAGGEAEYSKIIDWAKSNLSTQQVDAYDQVIDTGNVSAIQIAFNGLRSEYEKQNGYEGRMLQGKPANNKGDLYRSQAELVRAMSDPRYDNDPAYRADVIAKLEQSDLNF